MTEAKRRRILSGSFLRAHPDSHFSALKGSINRGALLYLPSLPTMSFFLCVKKKRLTKDASDIQTLPNRSLSLLHTSLPIRFVPFLPVSLFLYLLYIYAPNWIKLSLFSPSVLPALCFIFHASPSLSPALPFHVSHSLIKCLKILIFFSMPLTPGSLVCPPPQPAQLML